MATFFVRFPTAVAILVVGLTVVQSGCRRPEVSTPANALPDTLSAVVMSIRGEAFREAFSRLGSYEYTRYTRTEQFDGDDFMLAYRERVTRVVGDSSYRQVDLVSSDSAGDFRFGFFKRFVSENLGDLDPVNLAPYVLSDDPEYLRARNATKYEFRSLQDTLLWDTQARVIEVRARPEVGDGLNIRRVRYYVNRATNELVAMYLERVDLALLFREESRFYMHMRPIAPGVLLPYNSRFDTRIRTPFRKDHRFRTVSTYYAFQGAVATLPDSTLPDSTGPDSTGPDSTGT